MNAVQLFSKYSLVANLINRNAIEKKSHLLKFKSGENLFEVGCGTGRSTRSILLYIPNNYNKYIATDILKSMADQAREENTASNVEYDQLDISTEEPLKKEWRNNFDKVFSFCAIQWVPPEKLLPCYMNMNHLLKLNGTTFNVVIADSPIYDTYIDMYNNPKWRPYYKHQYEFQPACNKVYINHKQHLQAILKQTYHEIIDFDYIDTTYHFESLDEFKNSMMAISPFGPRIPTEQRDDYWNDVWVSYAKFCDVQESNKLWVGSWFLSTRKIKDF